MTLGKFARTAAVSIVALSTAGAAFAQDAQKPAAGAPQAAAGEGPPPMQVRPPSEWTKACRTPPELKKEICSVSRDVRSDTGQSMALVQIESMAGQPKKILSVYIIPGFLIPPGVQLTVDKKPTVRLQYMQCVLDRGCLTQAELTEPVLAAMKKGGKIYLQAMTSGAKNFDFPPLELDAFAKVFDGPGADMAQLQQQQQGRDAEAAAEAAKLNEGMAKRAEEERAKMQKQGGAPATGQKAP